MSYVSERYREAQALDVAYPRSLRGRRRARNADWRSMASSRPQKITVSRAWEHSVWRDAKVVIAESPAPHLSAPIETVLQTVASHIALGSGWIGMGRVTFSLDDCSKEFFVIASVPGRDALMHLSATVIPTGHALALHINFDSQPAIDVLIC